MASDNDRGMIELGSEFGKAMPMEMKSDKPSKDYPTLHIRDIKELDNLPSDVFYFMAKAKVVSHSEHSPVDGKGGCNCDIAIIAMKPMGHAKTGKNKPVETTAEEGLDKALNQIESDKEDMAEE